SGTVKLDAQNGPISVKLNGQSWPSGTLEAHAHNGPLSLKLPAGYRSGVVVESDGHGPVSCHAEACRNARRSYDDDDNMPRRIEPNLPTCWPFISVWIIGALYATLGANALAELAAMTPQSGGQYVFVRHALGDYAGFVVGWSDWISTCGTTALVTMTLGEYAV